jgi:hypothetical protein
MTAVQGSAAAPYPSYCSELGIDLKGLSYDKCIAACDEHIENASSKHHVCVWTLAKNYARGEEASNLSRCARCKGVYYSSVEGQKGNWASHKGSCKVPNPQMVAGLSLQAAWSKVKEQLNQGAVDENLALLLRHIRHKFSQTDSTLAKTLELEMHTVSRHLIFMEDNPRIQAFHESLWSAPGVADFFLYGEDLICRNIRRQRLIFPRGLPSEDGVKYSLKGSDIQDLAMSFVNADKALSGTDPATSGVYRYCYLHFNLILACAVVGKPSRRSPNDGIGKLRTGTCAEAATKRVLELWLDERTRLSCGDALAPAFSFAVTYIQAKKFLAGPGELAPGCPLDEVLKACLSEILENGGAAKHATKLLKMLAEAGKPEAATNPWDALDISRRAESAILLAESITCSEGTLLEEYNGEPAVTVWDLELHHILESICGFQAEKRLEIWRRAANGRDLCALGRLDTGRAFFHYNLLQMDIPDLIPSQAVNLDQRSKWELDKLAVGQLISFSSLTDSAIRFSNVPWPCVLWPQGATSSIPADLSQQMALSEEKLECYALAMEPDRFVDFDAMFNVKEPAMPGLIPISSVGSSKKSSGGGGGGGGSKLSLEELEMQSIEADRIARSLWEEEELEAKKKSSSAASGKGGKKKGGAGKAGR